jgi:hypothetical protein
MRQLSSRAGQTSDGTAGRMHRLSSAARGEGHVRVVSLDDAQARDNDELRRLPHAPRRQAAAERRAVRQVPRGQRAEGRGSRRVHDLPRKCRPYTEQASASMRVVPRRQGQLCRQARAMLELPRRLARAEDRCTRLRVVSQRAELVCAEGARAVRQLPPTSCAGEDTGLRELPRRGSKDQTRRPRLRDVSPPAWSVWGRDTAIVCQLPCRSPRRKTRHEAGAAPCIQGAPQLCCLPYLTRGGPQGRSRDVPNVSSGSGATRANGEAMRDVSPLPLTRIGCVPIGLDCTPCARRGERQPESPACELPLRMS